MEFRYLEYSAGYFDTEWLSVYPRGGSSSRDIVTVRPAGYNENGTFTDNYIGVYVRPYYEEAIAQYVKDYFQSGNVLVIGPDSVKQRSKARMTRQPERSPETAAEAVIFTFI